MKTNPTDLATAAQEFSPPAIGLSASAKISGSNTSRTNEGCSGRKGGLR
jgi:hypothetical protein